MATPSGKAIFRHVWNVFGGDPKVTGYVRDLGGEEVDILRCVDRPAPGLTSWGTIGMFEGDSGNVVGDQPLAVELVGLSRTEVEEFGNLIASCAFNVLTGEYGVTPGNIYPDIVAQYLPDVSMKHMLLTPVFSWEAPANLEVDGRLVTWLQAVPVSDSEFEYASANGSDALESLLEQHDADITDIDRASVV